VRGLLSFQEISPKTGERIDPSLPSGEHGSVMAEAQTLPANQRGERVTFETSRSEEPMGALSTRD
jgi:hypothetical protein